MKYTAAHWGTYTFESGDKDLTPVVDDPLPSRIGRGWVSAATDPATRVLAPVVRKGWLNGDKGAARCSDSFVEITWDRATQLVASEIDRVRTTYGNQAIFGGSYGWSSAGRFHHAQGQMRRLLALAGGYTSSRETYSHAAAEVLFPRILGMSNRAFQDQMTSLPLVAEHCEFVLAFGGISRRTAQITSAGTATHDVGSWLDALKSNNVEVLSVAPERGEAQAWLPIRPGTDTALILALIHWIVSAGKEDQRFLARCTSGWNDLKAYVLGHTEGRPKTPAWAATICDIQERRIIEIARKLTETRNMISTAWGLQRADHGEQPIWAGLALAAVLGQIGQPGTGYSFGYGSVTAIGRPVPWIPWPSLPKVPNPVTDFIPVARIADALLFPNVPYNYDGETRHYPDLKLVWWSGGNPFHHHQDLLRLERAWRRPETIIVSEHSWTATARRADIVLPATTPLEREDLMMNRRDPALVYMSRFTAPMGQARDDFDFCAEIADKLNVGDAFRGGKTSAEWLAHLWDEARNVGATQNIDMPDFEDFKVMGRFDLPVDRQHRIAFADFVKDPEANPLGTESGKLTVSNQSIGEMDLSDCPAHPSWLPPVEGSALPDGAFHLISGQPATRLHGQNDMGSESLGAKVSGREVCTLHPAAAERLGVADGGFLRLYNVRGACICAVKTSEDIRLDCLSLPTGAWFDPRVINGTKTCIHGNPNVLTLDKGCSSLSQGNIAHTCVVYAEAWHGPLPELSVDKPPNVAL
ncbi:molybdopterin-dependent oxidoreductase [Yoonia sp. 2307UL14-13]|uniref:molybdopterin-dependent oxidoreductase n=1 Tax=Yoonia sp. 2307UL14-13 TaxID=3126506 RepID=UPI0030A4667A